MSLGFATLDKIKSFKLQLSQFNWSYNMRVSCKFTSYCTILITVTRKERKKIPPPPLGVQELSKST